MVIWGVVYKFIIGIHKLELIHIYKWLKITYHNSSEWVVFQQLIRILQGQRNHSALSCCQGISEAAQKLVHQPLELRLGPPSYFLYIDMHECNTSTDYAYTLR